MSKIISIGTALPAYRHKQADILEFMLEIYQPPAEDIRKIRLLYEHCGIETRYSAIADYSFASGNDAFYHRQSGGATFPTLDTRMEWYHRYAGDLSMQAISACLDGQPQKVTPTFLITVSCTGMAAPGLDIALIKQMGLPVTTRHTSVNFMGCYAAIHALKLADAICRADERARVLIVCTELCTLHFQDAYSMDHITSSLLFADGAAAVLVTGDSSPGRGLGLTGFYSEIAFAGESYMTWELSKKGFLMHLDALIPQLVKQHIAPLYRRTLRAAGVEEGSITRWAIHPGGRKILAGVEHALELEDGELKSSYKVLRNYGNMSSPTILFVLKEIMQELGSGKERIFTAAFGPGVTMETLILESL